MCDIYLYDVTTGQQRCLLARPGNQWQPSISGNKVVYEDFQPTAEWQVGWGYDLRLHDISTGEDRAICTAVGDQEHPVIDGDLVASMDYALGR